MCDGFSINRFNIPFFCKERDRGVLAAHDMSGFVAHDLSGLCFTCIGGEHEADGVATGDPDETISGRV